MAGRSTYSDEDKAAVLAVLAANGGNIKRTARETGIPVTTVRRWSQGEASPPPETVQAAVSEFVTTAERIRGLSLEKLEDAIRNDQVTGRDLITVVGVLDDKITRASGLPTNRTEHQHALPSREELQTVIGSAIGAMIEAAERRDGEIVDAEYSEVPEPRGLPSPSE